MPESATSFHQASLPKAVRRAARAAERAHEQAYSSKPNGNDSQGATPPSSDPPKPDEAPKQGDVVSLQAGSDRDVQQAPPPAAGEQAQAPTPTPPAGEQPPGDSSAPVGDDADLEKWKQRYQSLQGMIKSRDREIESLQRSLAALTAMKQEGAPAPAGGSPRSETPAQRQRRLRQEDVEAYGEDFIKVVQDAAVDAAMQEFLPELDKLRRENAELRNKFGGMEQRSQHSETERVMQVLSQHVPNWQQINEDPEFLEWLQQVDPMSGEPRQKLLDRATAAFDAPRVTHFFKAYLTESQAIRPSHPGAAPAAPVQQPAQPAPQRQPIVDATQMVAPGRPTPASGSGAGAASEGETPPVTESMISRFYNDVARGKYKQRPKEYQATQARIAKALAENRVVRDVRAR